MTFSCFLHEKFSQKPRRQWCARHRNKSISKPFIKKKPNICVCWAVSNRDDCDCDKHEVMKMVGHSARQRQIIIILNFHFRFQQDDRDTKHCCRRRMRAKHYIWMHAKCKWRSFLLLSPRWWRMRSWVRHGAEKESSRWYFISCSNSARRLLIMLLLPLIERWAMSVVTESQEYQWPTAFGAEGDTLHTTDTHK